MALPALIAYFSGRTDFPIYLDEVVDWIIANSFADEITFRPVHSNPKVLKGMFQRFVERDVPYGEPKVKIDILYEEDQSDCWVRYVCCKELMHVFDKPDAYTGPDKIDQLTFNLTSLPNDMEKPEDLKAENRAYHAALCVLAPLEIVRQLRKAVTNGTMTHEAVATYLRIPLFYVAHLLSEKHEHNCLALSK